MNLLKHVHDRYEHRPGQDSMADAVARAFATDGQLVVEAGTGTGKTLAYLIPALQSGEPVIVSTGTKALQAQLFEREAPLAIAATNIAARFSLLKGRENYLCKKRLAELSQDPRLEWAAEIPVFHALERWAHRTEFGDRAELEQLSDNSPLWRSVDGRAEICVGRNCAQYDGCFVYSARQRAGESQVLVVNHALLFADLALRQSGEGAVLPDFRHLIIDEAHLAAEIAAQHFGIRLSSRMLVELGRDGAKELAFSAADTLPATTLERVAREFFIAIRPAGYQARTSFVYESHRAQLAPLEERLRQALLELADACSAGAGPRGEERTLVAARCVTALSALDALLQPVAAGQVLTIEPQGRDGAVLASWPVEIGPRLGELFAKHFDAVVATSATLAVSGRVERSARALGMPQAEALIVPSPFDHKTQAALYVPRHFPDPREREYPERALREIESLIGLSRGRALVLFASHRALKYAAERLPHSLPYTVLVQGEAPREQLVEKFRSDTHSVLLGTASFRQGIDVPGEALSLVIVDKLPFAVPDDPLVAARADLVRRRGGDPFREDQLPEAILDLRQALGRLIRTKTDRGLLALLDVRVRTRPYGREVLRSLPPWPLIEDLEQAHSWLRHI
ncbi:MAG: ATP-dependent DNA helicase [Acidobacteriota bacterium]